MLKQRILSLVFIVPLLYIFNIVYNYELVKALAILDLSRYRLSLFLCWLIFALIGIFLKVDLLKVKKIFKGRLKIDIRMLLFSVIFTLPLINFVFIFQPRHTTIVTFFVAFLFGYYFIDSFSIVEKDGSKPSDG